MSRHTASSARRPVTEVQFRRTATATACALAIGTLAGTALAAPSTYTLAVPALTTTRSAGLYTDKFVNNDQTAVAPFIGATIQNVFVGAQISSGSGVPGAPVTIHDNSSTAIAIGNNYLVDQITLLPRDNYIDLGLMTTSAGILSTQLRSPTVLAPVAGTVVTTASQSGVTFGIQETNQTAAANTVTRNSLQALTTVNSASSRIVGVVPNGYTSAVQGSVVDGYTVGGISTSTNASVGITSEQLSINAGARAGSIATVDTSKVTLDMQQTGAANNTASSPLELTDNSIGVAYKGNDASSSVIMQSGGGTAFTGSVAVNNAQANVETTGAAGAVALVTSSSITADIRHRNTANRTDLAAPLTVSGNSLTASASGNSAGTSTSSGITAGNQIVTGTGISITGTTSPTTTTLANGASTLNATVNADLVVANGQGNQGTDLRAQINDGVVSTKADNIVAGGSITENANTVGVKSTGNLAGNLIATDSPNFTATAAIASSQSNDATPIQANNFSAQVTVGVGTTGVALTGSVTANSNQITADATGSAAASTLNLAGTNVTALLPGGAASQTQASTAGFGAASTQAGAAVTNLQGNYGATTTIGATVINSNVAVLVSDQTTPTTLVGTSAATITLDGNGISANATGNSAGSAVLLTGSAPLSNVSAQAGVTNTQFNGNIINGTITDSGVTARMGTVTNGSLITLTNTNIAATATANSATNSVGVDGTNVTTGATSIASGTAFAASTNGGAVAQSNANFSIASGQRNEAGVSATNVNSGAASSSGGSSAVIYAGVAGPTPTTGVNGSTLTASNNSDTAATTGNRVTNTIQLDATSLDTVANAATQIAGIANLQINAVTGVADAVVGGTLPGVTREGIVFANSAINSTLTASDNTVASSTLGNVGSNTITVNATALTSAAPGVATGTAFASTGQVKNEFGVVNTQTDSVSGGRTATTQSSTVGISDAGVIRAVTNSTLTASGNQITAEARNNDAGNAINLTDLASLSSGAGLVNQQSSNTAVTAFVDDGRIRIRAQGNAAVATPITGSTEVVSGNLIKSLAVGSSAGNAVTVQGDSVSGNASLTGSNISFGATVPDVTADYAIANSQSQTNTVTATTNGFVLVQNGPTATNLGANLTGSTVTVADNKMQAIAQATSGTNTLTLGSTGNVTGTTGGVGSYQTTTGAVSATTAGVGGNVQTIGSEATTLTSTSSTTSGNQLLSSAGQNEAFNTLNVTGTGISGRGLAASTDFSVANSQVGAGNVTALTDANKVGIMADIITGGSATVSGNSVQSVGSINTSTDRLTIDAAGNVSANAGVRNSQSAISGVLSATTTVTSLGVRPNDGGAVDPNAVSFSGTTISVADNTVSAQATRNTSTNALSVSGANVSGSTNSAFFGSDKLYTTANIQDSLGATSASTTTGVLGVTVHDAATTVFSVTGNTVDASANANVATNSQTQKATSTLTSSGLVTNSQTSGSGTLDTVTATATTTMVGLDPSGAGTEVFTAGGPITVANNTLSAQAGRNSANNSLSASGATITGNTTVTPASFTVTSSQTGSGSVSATNATTSIGLQAATVTSNTVTVADNTASASAFSNSASNTQNLAATSTLTGSGAVSNTQGSSNGSVDATLTSTRVGLTGTSVTSSPVTVSGNTQSAAASRNVATNSLSATGATISGTAATPASFTVTNAQTATENVNATGTVVTVGVFLNGVVGTATSSPLTISDNTVTANANGNTGTNTVTLNATTSLSSSVATQANGAVSNTQTITNSAVTADVTATRVGSVTTGALTSSPVAVDGNSLDASASGNAATNGLTATSATVTGGTTAPSFSVSNTQTAAADFTATNTTTTLGVTAASATSGALGVNNNTVSASASGNSATNTETLAATSALSGTGIVTSGQISSGVMTATATTTLIGVSTPGNLTSSPATVSGNTLSASAQRNSAGNTLTATGASIAGGTQVPASFFVSNTQNANGAISATANSTTLGVSLAAGTSSDAVASDNVTESLANANTSTNRLTLDATGALTGTGRVANSQTTTNGLIAATTNAGSVGVTATGALSANPATVSGNASRATASGNVATNALTADAASINDATAPTFSVNNSQIQTNDVTALDTGSLLGISAGSTVASSNLTVSGNSVTAVANGNTGISSAALSVDSGLTATGLVNNDQTSSSTTVGATATRSRIGVVATGALTSSPATVSGNTVTASATRNVTSNTLDVTGAAVVAGAQAPAGFAVASSQLAVGGTSASATVTNLGTDVAAITSSAQTVSGNKVKAMATANSADNRLNLEGTSSLTGPGATGGTGSVVNSQVALSSTDTISATVNSTLTGVNATGAINTSPITVSGNELSASSGGNAATNALVADAPIISGGTEPAFATRNSQNVQNAVTASATVTTLGATVTAPNSSAVTVSANKVTATATGNNAANSGDITASSSVTGNAVVTNNQLSVTGANTAGVVTGLIGMSASGGVTSGPVTVSANESTANSSRNVSDNSLNVTAATITGGTAPAFQTTNTQNAAGAVTATNNGTTLGASFASATGSTVTVADNKMQAFANANTGTSTQTLDASGTLTGTGAVSNSQISTGAAISATVAPNLVPGTLNVGVFDTGTIGSSSVTVSANVIKTGASGNVTANGLSVDGATVTGGTATSFSVGSTQIVTNDVTASTTLNTLGTTFSGGTGSTVGVTGNIVAAIADGNVGTNTGNLNASSTFTGTGGVTNNQTAQSAAQSATVVTSFVGSNNGGTLTSTPVGVTGNTLIASASRNIADNALTVTGGQVTSTSLATSNTQFALGPVTATNTNPGGFLGSSVGSDVTASSTQTVAGNKVDAFANGNTTTNALTMSATGTLTVTGNVGSSQLAAPLGGSGNITALAGMGSTLGVTVGGNLTASPVSVADNEIVGSASGNVGTNTLLGEGATITGTGLTTNSQTATNVIGASAGAVGTNLGVTVTGATGTSALGVTGNTVGAYANSNVVTNSATLDASGTLTGGAGVGSTQVSVSSGVTAQADLNRAGASITGSLTASPTTVSSNTVIGSASRNTANNTTTVTAGTLTGTAAPSFDTTNNQTADGAVTGSGSVPTLGASVAAVTGSALTVSKNTIAGTANGNSAGNTTSMTADAGLTGGGRVLNTQLSSNGTIGATATSGTVLGVAATGAVSTSPITVSDNRVRSSGSGNLGINALVADAANITGADTYVVTNGQTQLGDVTASSSAAVLGATLVSATDSAVTVADNAVTATANGNTAANSSKLTADAALTTTGTVTNTQSSSSTNLSATTTATRVGELATGALSNSPVTVSGNQMASDASRNIGSSTLSASGASTNGAFTVTSTQTATNGVTASTTVGAVGEAALSATSSAVTTTDNRVTALARSNRADNALALDGTSTLLGSGTVTNTQTATTGTVQATVGTTTVGAVVPDLTSSPATVSNNALVAQAGRNASTDSLTASGAVIGTAGTPETFTVTNTQTAVNAVSASNTLGVMGAQVSGTAQTASNLSVMDNDVASVANANTTRNTMALDASSALTGRGAVSSTQTANGGLVSAAVTSAGVGVINGVLNASPATVSGNNLAADASRNVASNELTANATTLTGTGAVPQFTVTNRQDGSDNVTATNRVGLIGTTTNTATNSALTVNGNTASSAANVNISSNTLSLNAVSALNSNGQVSNTQNSGPAATTVTATTDGTSAGSPALVGVGPTAGALTLNTSPVTVTGNQLTAQGGGNTSQNLLEATSDSTIGAGTVYTFAALNVQNNYATVNTTVQFFNVGLINNGTSTLNGVASTVASNQVVASGYGNMASNAVGLSALSAGQNTASAQVSNTQLNTGNISSNVTGVNVGVVLTTGGTINGGSVVVGGNNIVARATGNAAGNAIVSK